MLLLVLLTVLCIAGGASRGNVVGQVIVRAVAVAALTATALLSGRAPDRRARPVFLFLAASIGLVLMQIVPLPPSIWTRLPGRAVFEHADTLLARGPAWRTWAIAPELALNALFSLLPPLATLVLMAGITQDEQRKLPGVLLCLVLASALLAALQYSGAGIVNPLVNATPDEVSAFFANRNHLALLLAQGCLLVPGWALLGGGLSSWRVPVSLGLLALFLLTILATGSRAGVLLGIVGLGLSAVLAHKAIGAELARGPRWVGPAVIAGIGVVLASLVLGSIAAGRAASIERAIAIDPSHDIRSRALPTVATMILAYFPAGSGAGSFDAVFRLHEPFELLEPTYFNHAHNDFLEISLDMGLAGMLLLVAAVAWWTRASVAAWRAAPGAHCVLPRLGSAMLLLVFLASLFDYPARTPIIMATMVIAAVWLGGGKHQAGASALPPSG